MQADSFRKYDLAWLLATWFEAEQVLLEAEAK
jgi:hypothetical protein